jgi:beta-barrel assembly-enhancing protease
LAADPALQRYVNVLGRWLALQTERPDLPWIFGVLDDAGFNAFATPGGHIFVTRGLVMRMRNEAELAGVLAHEIVHVLKKHHLKAVQKNAGFALAGDLLDAVGKGGNDRAKAAFLDIGRKLYASGLDQSDEFEADRMGWWWLRGPDTTPMVCRRCSRLCNLTTAKRGIFIALQNASGAKRAHPDAEANHECPV